MNKLQGVLVPRMIASQANQACAIGMASFHCFMTGTYYPSQVAGSGDINPVRMKGVRFPGRPGLLDGGNINQRFEGTESRRLAPVMLQRHDAPDLR